MTSSIDYLSQYLNMGNFKSTFSRSVQYQLKDRQEQNSQRLLNGEKVQEDIELFKNFKTRWQDKADKTLRSQKLENFSTSFFCCQTTKARIKKFVEKIFQFDDLDGDQNCSNLAVTLMHFVAHKNELLNEPVKNINEEWREMKSQPDGVGNLLSGYYKLEELQIPDPQDPYDNITRHYVKAFEKKTGERERCEHQLQHNLCDRIWLSSKNVS